MDLSPACVPKSRFMVLSVTRCLEKSRRMPSYSATSKASRAPSCTRSRRCSLAISCSACFASSFQMGSWLTNRAEDCAMMPTLFEEVSFLLSLPYAQQASMQRGNHKFVFNEPQLPNRSRESCGVSPRSHRFGRTSRLTMLAIIWGVQIPRSSSPRFATFLHATIYESAVCA